MITNIQEGDEKDIDLAVRAARKAFDEGPWRRSPPEERRRVLLKLADLFEKHSEDLAGIESLDNGKVLPAARADVQYCIEILRYYAGWTEKVHGKTIPISGPYFCYTREEPVGVCG